MCSPAFAASRLYQGMDVSSWQGDIDYQAVRAAVWDPALYADSYNAAYLWNSGFPPDPCGRQTTM